MAEREHTEGRGDERNESGGRSRGSVHVDPAGILRACESIGDGHVDVGKIRPVLQNIWQIVNEVERDPEAFGGDLNQTRDQAVAVALDNAEQTQIRTLSSRTLIEQLRRRKEDATGEDPKARAIWLSIALEIFRRAIETFLRRVQTGIMVQFQENVAATAQAATTETQKQGQEDRQARFNPVRQSDKAESFAQSTSEPQGGGGASPVGPSGTSPSGPAGQRTPPTPDELRQRAQAQQSQGSSGEAGTYQGAAARVEQGGTSQHTGRGPATAADTIRNPNTEAREQGGSVDQGPLSENQKRELAHKEFDSVNEQVRETSQNAAMAQDGIRGGRAGGGERLEDLAEQQPPGTSQPGEGTPGAGNTGGR